MVFSNFISIPPWSSTNFKSWLFKMIKLVKGRLHLNLSHRQLHAKIMLKILKSTNMFKIDDFSQLYQLIQRVQLLDFLECFKLLAPLNLPSTKGLSVAFSVLEHISEREIQIFFLLLSTSTQLLNSHSCCH